MAWREAYGFYDNPERTRGRVNASEFTDFARDGIDYRDGYYFADTYTTVAPSGPFQYDPEGHWASQSSSSNGAPQRTAGTRPSTESVPAPRVQVPASPFYLSVDSPIDQAPSIDAVAAARLRGLSVTHINHLMQQDSNRLADALGLANVDASTIRRWQAECRLVCRVPQLRGFDARVLVGCGVTTPAQLASIHPVDLLQEVEEFLATERGQQILLSGSSHELSRITSWIAAANSSSGGGVVGFGRDRDSGGAPPRQRRRSYYRGFKHTEDPGYAFDSDGYEYRDGDGTLRGGSTGRRRRRIIRTMNERDAASNSNGKGRGRSRRSVGSGNGSGAGYAADRSARGTNRSSQNGSRSYRTSSRDGNGSRSSNQDTGRRRRSRRDAMRSTSSPRAVVQYERERVQREPRETARATRERRPRNSGPRIGTRAAVLPASGQSRC